MRASGILNDRSMHRIGRRDLLKTGALASLAIACSKDNVALPPEPSPPAPLEPLEPSVVRLASVKRGSRILDG